MTKAILIPCDFNLAFYKVMSEVKYDDYHNSKYSCVWYKDGKKVAHYNKQEEMLWIYMK